MSPKPLAVRWSFIRVFASVFFSLALGLGIFYPSSAFGQSEKSLYPPEWIIGQKWIYTVVDEGLSDCISCGGPFEKHQFEVEVTSKKTGPVFDTLAFRAKVDSLPKNSNVPRWTKTGTGTSLFNRERKEFLPGELPVFMMYKHLPKHYSFLDSAHTITRSFGNNSSTSTTHVDTLSTSMGPRKAIGTRSTSSYDNSQSEFLFIEGWGIVYGMQSVFYFPSGNRTTWVLHELTLPGQSPITTDAEAWHAKVMAKPVTLFRREKTNPFWSGNATDIKPQPGFGPKSLQTLNLLGRITGGF